MCKQGFSFTIATNGTPTLTRDGRSVCQLVEMGNLYHYPRRLFFPQFRTDAEWLQNMGIARDTCGVPRPVVPYEVRRGKVVSSGASESDMRRFGKYEEFARDLDSRETSTSRLTVEPTPSFRAHPRQILAELPTPLLSYRDEECERNIEDWRNTKATSGPVARDGSARSAELSAQSCILS